MVPDSLGFQFSSLYLPVPASLLSPHCEQLAPGSLLTANLASLLSSLQGLRTNAENAPGVVFGRVMLLMESGKPPG